MLSGRVARNSAARLRCWWKRPTATACGSLFGPRGGRFLRHLLTGEVVELTGEVLDLADSGVAFLTVPSAGAPDDQPEESVWANDVLDLSWHSPADGDERQEDFIFSKSSDSSDWVGSIAQKVKVLSFKHTLASECFQGEVYVHQLPKHGRCIWWTAPWFQHAVFGADLNNRWVCRHFMQWQGVLLTGGAQGVIRRGYSFRGGDARRTFRVF